MKQASGNGLTRRKFLKVLGFTTLAAALGNPFKALAAGPSTIAFKALNPRKNGYEVVFTKDSKGRKIILRSNKPLTDGPVPGETRVTVSTLLPNHPDARGNPQNDLPFKIVNGEWSIVPGANYKDGQRCDQDSDMVALAAYLKDRVAEAATPLNTPYLGKITTSTSVGAIYREGFATRVDIDNTTFNVSARLANNAFKNGKGGIGPFMWSVDAPVYSVSEKITDIANALPLANPAQYSSDQKRAIAATLMGLALQEGYILRNEYRNEVGLRKDAKGNPIPDMQAYAAKQLSATQTYRFTNPADQASFEAALKGSPQKTMATLAKLLTPAPNAPGGITATPPTSTNHL